MEESLELTSVYGVGTWDNDCVPNRRGNVRCESTTSNPTVPREY